MQVYRSTFQYLRVLLTCTVLAIIVGVLFKGNKLLGILIVYAGGLIYVLPSVIGNPKIELNDQGILTYSLLWSKRSVDLSHLTNCNYRLVIPFRGIPYMGFHLYDTNGGFVDIPANNWSNRQKLYTSIASAVTANHVDVNDKTAKKLGLVHNKST